MQWYSVKMVKNDFGCVVIDAMSGLVLHAKSCKLKTVFLRNSIHIKLAELFLNTCMNVLKCWCLITCALSHMRKVHLCSCITITVNPMPYVQSSNGPLCKKKHFKSYIERSSSLEAVG